VLDKEISKETPLILGRPFLSTARPHIDVGAREIRFNINGKEERFPFQPKKEQCSMIKIKYGPNPQCVKEVKVTSPIQTASTTMLVMLNVNYRNIIEIPVLVTTPRNTEHILAKLPRSKSFSNHKLFRKLTEYIGVAFYPVSIPGCHLYFRREGGGVKILL
jgi:hypothetical protein